MAAIASDLGVAIELMQVRTGESVDRPTIRGVVPVDQKEVRRKGMSEVWERIRGKEGRHIRERVGEVKEIVVNNWRTGGMRKAMEWFATRIEKHGLCV